MTRRERYALAISLAALIVSCLSFVVSMLEKDEAHLYIYDGTYDLTSGFKATFNVVLVNSGDFDVLVSDFWLTIGDKCSLTEPMRITPDKPVLLASKSNELATASYRFSRNAPLSIGTHSICLYVETVTSRGVTQDVAVGEDSLMIDVKHEKTEILNPNPARWKKVLPLYSKRTIRSPF